jgi:hypothetical protein
MGSKGWEHGRVENFQPLQRCLRGLRGWEFPSADVGVFTNHQKEGC